MPTMGDQGETVTWPKIIMWGLIPLLGVVFTAGGGWFLLADLSGRLDKVEVNQTAGAASGLERRVGKLEVGYTKQDERLRNMERDVIAICVATGAQCN